MCHHSSLLQVSHACACCMLLRPCTCGMQHHAACPCACLTAAHPCSCIFLKPARVSILCPAIAITDAGILYEEAAEALVLARARTMQQSAAIRKSSDPDMCCQLCNSSARLKMALYHAAHAPQQHSSVTAFLPGLAHGTCHFEWFGPDMHACMLQCLNCAQPHTPRRS